MKTLYLLRHAKSARGSPDQADRARPLNARGIKASEYLGSYLKDNRIRPDLILCSSARRTRQTIDQIMKANGETYNIRYLDNLYAASTSQLLAAVRAVPDTVANLMIVGHNPGLEDLAHLLVSTGKAQDIARLETGYPAGTLAAIIFECDRWQDAGGANGTLSAFVIPQRPGYPETTDALKAPIRGR